VSEEEGIGVCSVCGKSIHSSQEHYLLHISREKITEDEATTLSEIILALWHVDCFNAMVQSLRANRTSPPDNSPEK
jgi:hypothetical protein